LVSGNGRSPIEVETASVSWRYSLKLDPSSTAELTTGQATHHELLTTGVKPYKIKITMEHIHVQSVFGYKINPIYLRASFALPNQGVFYEQIN